MKKQLNGSYSATKQKQLKVLVSRVRNAATVEAGLHVERVLFIVVMLFHCAANVHGREQREDVGLQDGYQQFQYTNEQAKSQ